MDRLHAGPGRGGPVAAALPVTAVNAALADAASPSLAMAAAQSQANAALSNSACGL